jgi:F5/8 type C domain
MRKRLITPITQDALPLKEGWLDLDRAAVVEVTSEEKEYPVESALIPGETRGWRAAESAAQTIRLIFDQPQRITRISLVFEETEAERTQEFVLRWSPDGGRSFREIVRQQWNFTPPNATREIEEYQVQLSNVTTLELVIVPDISRGAAHASIKSLRLS